MAVPRAGGVTSALNSVYTILSCGRSVRRLITSTLRGRGYSDLMARGVMRRMAQIAAVVLQA